jgi:hypothetical protein
MITMQPRIMLPPSPTNHHRNRRMATEGRKSRIKSAVTASLGTTNDTIPGANPAVFSSAAFSSC